MNQQYEQRKSGLIAPVQPPPPEPPKIPRGPIEYADDIDRVAVAKALEQLWTAMGLHRVTHGIVLPEAPSEDVKKSRSRLFKHVRAELLGEHPGVEFVGGWEYT